MTFFQWLLVILLYLLSGQIFSLVYTLNFKPEKNAMLGLLGLFWPIALVLDILFSLGASFGKSSVILSKKIKPTMPGTMPGQPR